MCMRRVHCSHMESSNPGGYPETNELVRWSSGEKVDPRLLALLESFEEMYVKRHDLFKKIFPGDHRELFRKIGDAKTMNKKKESMRRSQSIGPGCAVKGRGLDSDGIDEFKVERFKVKTPIVIEEDGQGGTSTTLGGSSKDSKCTVCLSEYHNEDKLRILPVCGHSFHATCIDIWLHQHFTCPICRISLRELPERKWYMQPMFSSAIRSQYAMQSIDPHHCHCMLNEHRCSLRSNNTPVIGPIQGPDARVGGTVLTDKDSVNLHVECPSNH